MYLKKLLPGHTAAVAGFVQKWLQEGGYWAAELNWPLRRERERGKSVGLKFVEKASAVTIATTTTATAAVKSQS